MFQYAIPEYIDNKGDCSRLKVDDNESMVDKRIESVLKGLYRNRCLDYFVIKKKCSEILNQKNLIPLYIGENEFIAPIKIRRPRTRRDSLYGYVNVHLVKSVLDGSIVLKDNTKIPVLDSKRCIKRRLKMASTIEKYFYREEAPGNMLRGDLECAATRDDIALVLLEIKRIEREIRRSMGSGEV